MGALLWNHGKREGRGKHLRVSSGRNSEAYVPFHGRAKIRRRGALNVLISEKKETYERKANGFESVVQEGEFCLREGKLRKKELQSSYIRTLQRKGREDRFSNISEKPSSMYCSEQISEGKGGIGR